MPRYSPTFAERTTPEPLPARIRKALQEGRLPQALELAKQMHAQEPTDESRKELQRVYLAGIRFHIGRDAPNDARRLIEDAEKLNSADAAWWESLAFSRAQIGDSDRARQLLAKAPESTMLPRLIGIAVDRAMADRQRGRDLLAVELRPDFELIRQAFIQYDQGHDDAARQLLQGIGLQSPFSDWKLLLRGLIAFSANDDARALENWSRLDSERLPAKLAAPFRYNLDSASRTKLPADQVKSITHRASLLAPPITGQLRDLQLLLGSAEELPDALRKMSLMLGTVKSQYPHLVPKLANCFYWLIVQGGEPEDLSHYQRLFGPHPDDKKFNRLKAIVHENIDELDVANGHWKQYRDEIAADPGNWPGEFGKLAQAMIWARMGDNAQNHEESDDEDDDEDDDPFFEDFIDMIRGRKPKKPVAKKPIDIPAEKCYRSAIALAPDLRGASRSLIDLLANDARFDEAEAIARGLLERHPDDMETRRDLADLQSRQGKLGEAVESLKAAIKSNPLDRELRSRLGFASLEHARALINEGDFETADIAIRAAIEHEAGLTGNVARAMSLACAFDQGDAEKAERIRAEFPAEPRQRAAIAYMIVVESLRLKVPKAVLKEQQSRFDAILTEALELPELKLLASVFGYYRSEPKPYRGIGPHEKRISAQLQRLVDAHPPEEELVDLGFMFHRNRLVKLLQSCARQGQHRFPKNPCFSYLLAEYAILQRPKTFGVRQVAHAFRDVLEQIKENQDERCRLMREAIERRQHEHPRLDAEMQPRFGFGFPRGFPFF